MMYVLNVDEASAATGNAHSAKAEAYAKERGMPARGHLGRDRGRGGAASARGPGRVPRVLGLKETGLARVVRAGYQLLDLVTFFTVGPKEARAWTVRREATAPEAAGVIHTDFEKGFIRAETIAYDDYVTLNGEAARARPASSGSRARTTSSRTATSSTSASTSSLQARQPVPRAGEILR